MTPTTAKEAWARMSPEERLAMAKAAPKVATAWRLGVRTAAYRPGTCGDNAVTIWKVDVGVGIFKPTIDGNSLGYFPTLAQAQAACDAELIRQGYVLDNGETP